VPGARRLAAAAGIARLVLAYLGKDPNEQNPQDLAAEETVLNKIRPYIHTIDSTNIIESMANGDICIALGYNGDFVQARRTRRTA